MSISLAAKVGAAGTITAGGGVVGTYLAWDHITLYEVEREVINKNVQLDKENDNQNTSLTVVIKAVEGSSGFESLTKDYSWSCKIKIATQNGSTPSDNNKVTSLWNKLQINLPTAEKPTENKDKKLRNKKLLVKACSENRDSAEKPSYKKVIGTLDIKETEANGAKFSFEKNPDLADLLKEAVASES